MVGRIAIVPVNTCSDVKRQQTSSHTVILYCAMKYRRV